MPKVPEGAKSPTDRKAKKVAPPSRFTFKDVDGVTVTLETPTAEVMNGGLLRSMVRNQTEQNAHIFSEAAGDDALDAFDSLGFAAASAVMSRFDDHILAVLTDAAESVKPDKKERFGQLFTFEHQGETVTFEQSAEGGLSARWLLANRDDETALGYSYAVIAGSEALEILDGLGTYEMFAFQSRYAAYIDAAMGGSLGN